MKRSKISILIIIMFVSYILSSFIFFDGRIKVPSLVSGEKIELDKEYIRKNIKDFKITEEGLKSISDDPWISVNELSFKPRYITMNISKLNKKVETAIYYGIDGIFNESGVSKGKLSNGINIITIPNDVDFNTLRLDIVNEKDISLNVEYVELSTRLDYSINFIVLNMIIFIAILLLYNYRYSINNMMIIIKSKIRKNEKYCVRLFKNIIIISSILYLLIYTSSNKWWSFIVVIIIFGSIYFLTDKIKNYNKLFLIISVTIGVIFSILLPPMQAPDEDVHLIRSYYLADGNIKYASRMEIPNSIKEYLEVNGFYSMPFNYQNKVNKEQYDKTKYKELDSDDVIEMNDSSRTKSYLIFAYLPQAIGMFIAKVLDLSPFYILLFGRISNLLIWVFICNWALKVMPIKKKLLMMVMLLPMGLHQAASLSPDAILNSSSFLMFAYIINLKCSREFISYKNILVITLCSICIVSVKLPYILLIILMMIIPKEQFNKIDRGYIGNILIKYTKILTPIISVLLYYILSAKFMIDYSMLNIDSSVVVNSNIILSIVFNINKYIYILINTVFENNFFIHGIVGIFGWLDAPLPKTLVITTIISMILYASKYEDNKYIGWKDKLIFISILIIVIAMLVAVAIQWTGIEWINLDIVGGIQGRYFIPFAILFFMLFYNNKYKRFDSLDYKSVVNILVNCNIALVYAISIIVLIYRYWI